MNISYNWLKQYLDFDLPPEETENKLTLLGLEVEGLTETGSDLEGFVVGEVKDVLPHPNADKLQVCKVDLGKKEVQIVCGAPNVAAGQKVPVATVGSVMPLPLDDGSLFKIKKAKLRGEASHGMICSESELGLSDDHTGIMVLNDDIETGTPLNTVLEMEKDIVFEIGLTPNRPDAACHIGVARDLAAVIGKPLKNPYKEITTTTSGLKDKIDITITDSDKCHRYVGLMVEGVTVEESPAWLKNRLTAIGLRPINNVVDVTNYVLHEIGQPLHAFDYKRVVGKKIDVKSFDKNIKFTTLDSVTRNVPAGSLFICDGNGPVAIAGVMGGENSEVTETTDTILIESAYFEPSGVRKTSKALALQTDSSYRFERGIDPTIQLKAARRAAELIAEIAGGTIVDGAADVHPVEHQLNTADLRISRVNHLLGTDLKSAEIKGILISLEFGVTKKDEDTFTCTIPPFRPDVTREVDLIEEVGRVFDYNNIPTPKTAPFRQPETLSEPEIYHQRYRNYAASLGYKEITSNSLLSKKEATALADENLHVDTLNPVSQENTTLRPALLGGFLKSLRYNLNRGAKTLRFFEIGHVFHKSDESTWVDGVKEHNHLLLGICGSGKKESWQGKAEPFTIFDLKADLESLFNNFGIRDAVSREAEGNEKLIYRYGDQQVATLFRVDDQTLKSYDVEEDAYVAEADLTLLFNIDKTKESNTYTPVPKFPIFEFDAAFTVNTTVRAGDLEKEIRKSAGSLLHSLSVFDVYEGENLGKGKKSIAFRLNFLDPNKTLNIKDVEPVVQKIVRSLEKHSGAKLRS
ncbi:MAG: phenylalanine--tRNA ligase subunit beta [Balneolaceae bacterium]|nr:phenylalanine--tRNA ligase subunit beta [Balneolaceae bacterium]